MTFVVGGGIVRNRAWILSEHIDAVADNEPEQMFYVTGDNNDQTEDALSTWADRDDCHVWRENCFDKVGRSYLVHNTGEPSWTRDGKEGPRYKSSHMAAERNLWAQEALKRWPQATHLWVVDSDVLPAPDVLDKLLAVDAPVAGAYVPVGDGFPIYMEGMRNGKPYRTGQERHRTEPFECSLVGGCYLFRADTIGFPHGYPWSEHKLGEDGGFAAFMRAYGHKMMAVPGAKCEHLMTRDDR